MVNHWPKGYQEPFANDYKIDSLVKALRTIPNGGSCLEIGCGNGYWTEKLLVPKFDEVVCVDIINRPKYFKGEYHKTDSCILPMFKDKAFDFVYSFGVFCHFDLACQKSYLNEIRRVLTGAALILFANWPRFGKTLNNVESDGWYYNDLATAKKMVMEAGFTEFTDFDPTFRDTIAIIK